MEALSCSRCGAALTAKEIDRSSNTATCGYCLTDLSLEEHDDDELAVSKKIVPWGFETKKKDGKATISWRWSEGRSKLPPVIILFFGLPYSLIGIPALIFLSSSIDSGEFEPLVLVPVVFTVLGLSLTYLAASMLFNRATVICDQSWLWVRHSPLPWPPFAKLRHSNIAWFSAYGAMFSSRTSRGNSRYRLRAVFHDGRSKVLLRGLLEHEADYLEQELPELIDKAGHSASKDRSSRPMAAVVRTLVR